MTTANVNAAAPATPACKVWAPEGVTAPAIDWATLANREWDLLDDDGDIDANVDYDYRLFAALLPRRPRPTLFDYVDPTGEYDGILTIDFAPGNPAWPNSWDNNGGIAYAKYETANRVEYHWDWPEGVAQ